MYHSLCILVTTLEINKRSFFMLSVSIYKKNEYWLVYIIIFKLFICQYFYRPEKQNRKKQHGLDFRPQCTRLTQILHQNSFVVFLLQRRHAVVHHQLCFLRQIYGHFRLDSTEQEGLQDTLQLSSWKQRNSTRDSVCPCSFNEQLPWRPA